MRSVFPTKELRDEAVEKYHAIEGGQQTLNNLAAYIRLFEGVDAGRVALEQVRAEPMRRVTQLTYAVRER